MIYLYASKKQKIQLKNMAGNSAGNIKELWDNLNHSNILLNGVPKREERENKYIKKKNNGQEKDWPKRPSDHQLQEARKKTLMGP